MPHLNLSDFFDGLAIANVTAQIDSNTSSDEQGSGDANRASYGTRMWFGTVNITPLRHDVADQVAAKIQYLEEADVTFAVFPNHLAGKTVTTGTVVSVDAADRRNVSLSEARPVGDIFGVTFSSGKKSMHRVVINGGGAAHVVVPAFPFGVAPLDVVTFGRPDIKANLITASLPNYRARLAFGATFEWRQTY